MNKPLPGKTTPNLSTKPTQIKAERNLVLIGYRATGKTSVGAELARILHRPFVDLDQVLVAEAGQSVAEIVAQGGWEEFRRREKDLVDRYRHSRGQVLATGGGVVLDPENVEVLRENGVIIWLTADPATIQDPAGGRPAPGRLPPQPHRRRPRQRGAGGAEISGTPLPGRGPGDY